MPPAQSCTNHVFTCKLKQIVTELRRSLDDRAAHNDAVWHDILTELAEA